MTVPRYVAAALASQSGLTMADLPFESPRFEVSIAWSPLADGDPGERLFRELLVELVAGRLPPGDR